MNLDEIHDQVHDLLDLVHEQVRSFDQQQNPDPLRHRSQVPLGLVGLLGILIPLIVVQA